MYTISLNNNKLDFKTLEQKIYRNVCEIACDVLKDVLGKLDKMLMATRDTDKYRHKGIKDTHINMYCDYPANEEPKDELV